MKCVVYLTILSLEMYTKTTTAKLYFTPMLEQSKNDGSAGYPIARGFVFSVLVFIWAGLFESRLTLTQPGINVN